MYRTLPYTVLFAAAVLLQVFLFDNLSIGIYFTPLVYIVFVLLLPMDTPHAALLAAGLVTGVVMDFAMGAAGVNTIATLFIAFVRPWVLGLFTGRDDAREGGVPSPERMGPRKFVLYLIVAVLLHHLVFFSFEALSWSLLLHTALRIVVSSASSVLFIWLIARVFTAKFPVRI